MSQSERVYLDESGIELDEFERIKFITKPQSYLSNIKRIFIIWFILIICLMIILGAGFSRLFDFLIIVIFLDFFTFFLPGISKKYIVTNKRLIRKSWFGNKEAYYEDIGSVTAAKGRILVVNRTGKVYFKIYELYFHPSVREEFKDLLFKYVK
ncbi:MAG: hypothetical protein FWD21_00020 [Peptococcaceae bacterium]|nr:hypothetical protein [Peptococcaceae bacterium]